MHVYLRKSRKAGANCLACDAAEERMRRRKSSRWWGVKQKTGTIIVSRGVEVDLFVIWQNRKGKKRGVEKFPLPLTPGSCWLSAGTQESEKREVLTQVVWFTLLLYQTEWAASSTWLCFSSKNASLNKKTEHGFIHDLLETQIALRNLSRWHYMGNGFSFIKAGHVYLIEVLCTTFILQSLPAF